MNENILHLDISSIEVWVFVHVLQKSSGCADDDVASGHAAALELQVLPTDDEASGKVVVSTNLSQSFEDLFRNTTTLDIF
jgi:hypothetical protein